MTLNQIRYFLAACETLNFTRAAHRCNVAQPSLTRAIKSLEYELAGQLFIRRSGGPTLTRLGEEIRRDLTQVLCHVKAARTTADGWIKGTKGSLRIGVSNAANPVGVGQFLGAFRACNKDVTLLARESATAELLACLNRLDLDAALVTCPQGVSLDLGLRRLYEERLAVIVPAGHRLATLEAIPLTMLAGERVFLSLHRDFRDVVLFAIRAAKIDVRIAFHTGRDEWLVGMVAEGAGHAIVPEGQALPTSVTSRPLSDPALSQSVYFVLADDAAASPVVRRMSEFADRYLHERRAAPLEGSPNHADYANSSRPALGGQSNSVELSQQSNIDISARGLERV